MKRAIEIFSAGCPVCEETVQLVQGLSCGSCEVRVHDMRTAEVAARARQLGIRSLPAVAVNGKLVPCCAGRGVDAGRLRAAGLGRPL